MNVEAGNRARMVYDGMREELEEMRERRDALRVEYVTQAQDCVAMERAIEAMRRRVPDDEPTVAETTTAPASGVISFDGCPNTYQKLVRMAESWGGVVSAHDAAKLLIDMGVSKGQRANLVAALQKEMADRENAWEYVSPRTYRYLPYYRNGHGPASNAAGNGPE